MKKTLKILKKWVLITYLHLIQFSKNELESITEAAVDDVLGY